MKRFFLILPFIFFVGCGPKSSNSDAKVGTLADKIPRDKILAINNMFLSQNDIDNVIWVLQSNQTQDLNSDRAFKTHKFIKEKCDVELNNYNVTVNGANCFGELKTTTTVVDDFNTYGKTFDFTKVDFANLYGFKNMNVIEAFNEVNEGSETKYLMTVKKDVVMTLQNGKQLKLRLDAVTHADSEANTSYGKAISVYSDNEGWSLHISNRYKGLEVFDCELESKPIDCDELARMFQVGNSRAKILFGLVR